VRGNIRTISLRANTLGSDATIEGIGQLHAWLRRMTTTAEMDFRAELKYRAEELDESNT